jgi:hypothetical protein
MSKKPIYGYQGNWTTNQSRSGRGQSIATFDIFSCRVKDIILNNKHARFTEFGEWNSIGTIFIESTKNPFLSDQTSLIPAYPAFPNIKHYPLINELVPVIYLTDVDVTSNTNAVSAYYLPPINIWNSQIHNAVPSLNVLPKSQKKDYQQVEAGSIRQVSDQSTEINLGAYFNENNVLKNHPLLPYEGDIIYEGRFGNSIRLGSTVADTLATPNLWSEGSNNGDPITIIRNGQPNSPIGVNGSANSWVPILENINLDKSSIYLTSTQKVNLELATIFTNKLNSYNNKPSTTPLDFNRIKETPQTPDLYNGNQILLNSGRLVFNAKNDHILLSADKSIHLSSNGSINIDTTTISAYSNEIRLTAPKVYLGNFTGGEGYVGAPLQSVVLGDNLKQTLTSIIEALGGIANAMTTAVNAGGPVPSLQTEGGLLLGQVETLKTSLNILLSKNVKTI